MRTLPRTIASILLASSSVLAQQTTPWSQTSGPEGGSVTSIVEVGGEILASVPTLGMFRLDGESWEWIGEKAPHNILVHGDILLAPDNSGIHRSSDHGRSWSRLAGSESTLAAVYDDGFYMIANDSLYHSTDGVDWNVRGLASGVLHAMPVAHGGTLVVAEPYAPAEALRSTDGGATWEELSLPVDSSSSAASFFASSDGLYLAIVGEGFWFSEDGGESWSRLSRTFPGPDGFSRVAEMEGDLYVIGDQIYRLENAEWVPVREVLYPQMAAPTSKGLMVGTYRGIDLIDAAGEVHQMNDGLIATSIGELVAVRGAVVANSPGTLFRTTDAGGSWEPALGTYIGSLMERGGTLYAMAGPGPIVSSDGATTWSPLPLPSQIDASTIRTLELSGDGIVIGVASVASSGWSWHAGGAWISGDGGTTWRELSNGLPRSHGVAAPIISLTRTPTGLLASTFAGIYRRDDGSEGWARAESGLTRTEEYEYPTAIIPLGASTLLFFQTRGFVSNDGGATWRSMELPAPTMVHDGIWSVVDGKLLVSGYRFDETTFTPLLFRYDGETWEEISSTLPSGIRFTRFLREGSTLYAGTANRGVWTMPASVASAPLAIDGIVDAITLSPNPTTERATLRLAMRRTESLTLRLVDMAGRTLVTTERSVDAGENELPISLSGVAAGPYRIVVEGEGWQVERALIVRH